MAGLKWPGFIQWWFKLPLKLREESFSSLHKNFQDFKFFSCSSLGQNGASSKLWMGMERIRIRKPKTQVATIFTSCVRGLIWRLWALVHGHEFVWVCLFVFQSIYSSCLSVSLNVTRCFQYLFCTWHVQKLTIAQCAITNKIHERELHNNSILLISYY